MKLWNNGRPQDTLSLPLGNFRPWIVAVALSLLIHGGLLGVTAVKSYGRRQTAATPLPIGAGNGSIQFFASSGDGGSGDNEGRGAVNRQVPPQVEQVQPVPHELPETPEPASEASTGSLTASAETNPASYANAAVPSHGPGGSMNPGNGRGNPSGSSSVGGGSSSYGSTAAYARNPLPPYPLEARERRWQGTTLLRVEVLADGAAGKVDVAESSGYPILDEVSVQTVRDWKFLPARSGDTPVPSFVEIPIRFRLAE